MQGKTSDLTNLKKRFRPRPLAQFLLEEHATHKETPCLIPYVRAMAAPSKTPGRRLCAVTGVLGKYRDSSSGLAYSTHAAAEQLKEQGISCEVIDPRTLWPLDKETIINSVKKTGRCMVVTEASAESGWSAEASSVVHEHCFGYLKQPVKRHCGMRTGIPYGPTLERQCIPSSESIAGAVQDLLALDASSAASRQ